MTADEILRDIKAGKFAPVYFLHGEEPFYIDQIADAVEANALPEAERGFNQTILYGKEIDHLTLLDYLRRYPMMSERQVVILREAQEMKSLGELTSYLENPMNSTVFVACHKHKKVDTRTKFGKALGGKYVVNFESKKLYDNQVPDWIASVCKSRKQGIEPAAAALMAEYLGTDLARINNELDKLTLNLPPGSTITVAHVQDNIGISKEYNVFELQKALATRDKAKVARIHKNLRQLQGGDELDALLAQLKIEQEQLAAAQSRYVPLAVKIAPDLDTEQIKQIAALLTKHRIDGVIATNTTLARDAVAHLPHGNETGGLSGAPVRDKSTAVIRLLAAELGNALPVIGVGGILSGQDALEKMQAGAALIQLYSGLIYRGQSLVSECANAIKNSHT